MSAVVAASALASALASAVTPTPTPTPTGAAATSLGSPGITGFLVTFVLAVALIGLFLSLTRHLRIVDRRSRQREEQESAQSPADDDHEGVGHPATNASTAADEADGGGVGHAGDDAAGTR